MHYLRLVRHFVSVAFQNVLAYRTNFWISILYSLLNLGTGVLSLVILFGQVEAVRGWDLASTLALLGVYLTLGALHNLFIGPSLESLAGMDGEIWHGGFDFTLLRPVDTQFLASVRYWRPLALIDLALGLGVVAAAAVRLKAALTATHLLTFLLTLGIGITVLYAILLAFSALVLWSPGFLFTWVFNALFQMARYPVGLYPGWLRLVLTWVIPVGVMTTVPAQALTGGLPLQTVVASTGVAVVFFLGSSALFRFGLRRYASASS